MVIKILNALIAIVGGVVGAIVLYYLLNKLAELLPGRWEDRVKPYLSPARAGGDRALPDLPGGPDVMYSFANASSTAFVGLEQLHQPARLRRLPEHAVQHVAVDHHRARRHDRARPADRHPRRPAQPPGREDRQDPDLPADGDRRRRRRRRSGGSSTRANPPGQTQIGLLNAHLTGFGGDPVDWLQISTLPAQQPAAHGDPAVGRRPASRWCCSRPRSRACPTETLEAARIDGAGERQIFFRVVIPQIRATLITVFITVLIGVLKIFDIVYVMTNGNFNTNVIARRLLQPAVHQQQRRLRGGDRRHAADRR